MFNPQVAQLAGVDVMTVIASFSMQAMIGIVVATFIAIIKKFETRLVLLLSGLLTVSYTHLVLGMEQSERTGISVVKAQVPLAEMADYVTASVSYTHLTMI